MSRFLILFLPIFIFAQSENRLKIDFDSAMNSFKKADYEESYSKFNTLFLSNLNSIPINFYLGRSAFETKRYSEAILAFERVLFEDNNSIRTKLELARLFFVINNYSESKKYFYEVLEEKSLPKTVKNSIDLYLTKIDKKISKSSFNGILSLGYGYDSNINNRSNFDSFNNIYIPSYDVFLDMENSTIDDSDRFHQEIFALNSSYKLDSNTKIKSNLLYFMKNFKDYRDKNIKFISLSPSIEQSYSDFVVDYSLFGDSMWMSSQKYLKSFGLFPKLEYIFSKDIKFSSNLKYQIKEYEKANRLRDSKSIDFNNYINYHYSDDIKYIVNLGYSNERKDIIKFTDIDFDSFNFSLLSNYFLNSRLSIKPSFEYRDIRYRDFDISFQVKERVKEYRFNILSSYYFEEFIFQLDLEYLENSSNIDANDYDKYNSIVNIIRTF